MRLPWPIIVIALALPTAGALIYFVAADPESPLFRISYSVSKVLQFTFPILVLAFLDHGRLRDVRLSGRGLVGGLGFGFITLAAILAVYALIFRGTPMLERLGETARAKVAGLGLHSPAGFILLALFIAIAHSLLEEYYWRWFVHSALRERMSSGLAIAISSLAFAAHHVVVLDVYLPGRFWTATIPFSLGVAFGGACWAWWYDRTRSLAGPWAAHLLADVALMAIGFDLLYR
jgi:uncharacterized protein